MKNATIPAAAVVAALALGGCSDKEVSDEARRSGGDKPAAATTKGSRSADARQAVVLVEGIYGDRQTKATGVIFEAANGLALTANHAIEAAPSIIVTLADGSPRRGRIVARAQCHDLAVVRLTPKPTGVREIPFAPTASVSPGQPVRTLSYALASATSETPQLAFTQGSVAAVNVRQTFKPLPPMAPLIAHQTPLTPLGSGSPLLNQRGQLIGMNTLVAHPREDALPGVEYALSSDYIRKRLRELKPGPAGTLGGWRSDHDRCHGALNRLIAAGHTHDGASKGMGAPKGGGGSGGATHGSGGGHN